MGPFQLEIFYDCMFLTISLNLEKREKTYIYNVPNEFAMLLTHLLFCKG